MRQSSQSSQPPQPRRSRQGASQGMRGHPRPHTVYRAHTRRDRFVVGCAVGLFFTMLFLLVTAQGNTPGMATARGVNWISTTQGTALTGHNGPTPTATTSDAPAGSAPTATVAMTATDQPTASRVTPSPATVTPTAATQGTGQPPVGPTATATTLSSPTAPPTTPPTAAATGTVAPTPAQTGVPTTSATATVTATALPTVTPRPSPTATATATPSGPLTAVVRFTAASRSLSSNPALTGCPGGSGCDFPDSPISHSVTGSRHVAFSTSRQQALQGNLTVSAPNGANCSGGPCSVTVYAWVGGTIYGCGIYAFKLPRGGSTTIFCRLLYVTSPHSIAAGAFSNTCAGCGGNRNADITWRNPNPFYWVALESSSDCTNALGSARANAHNALITYWNTVTSGLKVVRGPSYSGYFNQYCNPGPGSYTEAFDAFASQTVSGLAYSPSQAQAAARRRLNALLASGYHWVSQTTCTPTTTGSSGNKVFVSCGESGVEAVTWTSAMKAQLAQALAGKTRAAATSQCNAYPGVAPGSCSIQLSLGSTLPNNPTAISVQASDPAVSAASAHRGPPLAAVHGDDNVGRILATIPSLPLLALPLLIGLMSAFGGALVSLVVTVMLGARRRWITLATEARRHTHPSLARTRLTKATPSTRSTPATPATPTAIPAPPALPPTPAPPAPPDCPQIQPTQPRPSGQTMSGENRHDR